MTDWWRNGAVAETAVLIWLGAGLSWAAPPRFVQINSARGQVEKLATGKQTWQRAKVRDKLVTGDQLRTGKKSTSVLRLDGADSSLVFVGPNTLLLVNELTSSKSGGRQSNLRVSRGRVRSRVRPFANPDSTFTIKTPACMGGIRGTQLAVTISQEGLTAFGVPEGAVAVTAMGQEVGLPEGTMNRTKRGEFPGPAEPLPESLEIVLEEPAEDFATNRREVALSGRTAPGAILTMNGEDLLVGDDGSFRLEGTLREGANTFSFAGVDVAGNTAEVVRVITLDTLPPKLQLH